MNVKADKPYLFFSFFKKNKLSEKIFKSNVFSFTRLTTEKKVANQLAFHNYYIGIMCIFSSMFHFCQ